MIKIFNAKADPTEFIIQFKIRQKFALNYNLDHY